MTPSCRTVAYGVPSLALAQKVVELQHESKIDWDFYLRNVMPVGASQAATLALGNAVYMYLTVSLIQVGLGAVVVGTRRTGRQLMVRVSCL
jgi:hypothetical protein